MTDPLGQPFNAPFTPGTSSPGAYTYSVNGIAPCPGDAAVITVNVLSNPNAGGDGALTLCADASASDLFALLAGVPDPGGSWIDPNGQASNGSFDPGTNTSGAYTYVIAVPPPCVNDSATVIVNVVTPPDAGTDGSVTLCPNGVPIALFSELGGSPDAGGTWTAPGGGASNGTLDPATDPAGVYTYTVIATTPCANDQATVNVIISEPITGVASASDAICNGACNGTASLQVNGGTPAYTFAWSGSIAGPLDTAASALCAGSYSVTITDASGCIGQTDFVIGEPPPLVIDGADVLDETCIGSCDGVINVADPEGVLYSFDNGATWQATSTLTGLCAGVYPIAMMDANGCMATSTATVESPPPVIAGFYSTPDTATVENPVVTFTNQSSGGTSWIWDFGGLGSSTDENPAFGFPDALGGIYTVCLTATNSAGCADSICHTVIVMDVLIVSVPNTFTPDGDGINDGFVPVFNIPAFVGNYEFMIFDRWGEQIFESHAVGEKWNGTMWNGGGEILKENVYVWKLQFRDLVSHERHDRTGHVTLLK